MGSILDKIRGVREKKRPFCTMIVPAAGTSRRMGGENKLWMDLAGAPVLMRTLCAIDQAEFVDEIVIAAQEELLLEAADLCSRAGLRKSVRVIRGGKSRTESVYAAALEASREAELLAVHDGARPLVRPQEIDEIIRRAWVTQAAAPAVPLSDTVKTVDENGLVLSTPARDSLRAVRTPQVFQANVLRAALKSALDAGAELTDDCAAVERLGKEVYLVPGDPENIKITTPLDLAVAEAILARRGRENR